MAQIQGFAAELRIGFESAYGTPITTTGYKVGYAPTLDAMTDQAINKSSVITGDANPSIPFLGFKDGKFSAQIPMDDKAIGLFFKGAFGAPTTTLDTPIVGLNTHVYKIGTTVPSMYAELEHTDVAGGLVYTTTGIGINTISFSLGGDGELLMNIAGIAKETTKGTATAMSSVLDYTDGFKFGQFEAAVTGVAKVKTFDFNYSNNVTTDSYIIDGTGTRGGVPKGVADVNGSMTSIIEDDTLYAQARDFTTLPLAMNFTNGGAGTALRTIAYSMLEAKLNATSNTSIAGADALYSSLNYEAFYTNATANTNETALQVTIVNEIASYA